MSNKYPFYYEVRFKSLVIDEDNNVEHHNFKTIFNRYSPLENRRLAFEAFDEYLSNLNEHQKVKKDEYGNLWIVEPSKVTNAFNETIYKKNEVNLEEMSDVEFFEYLESNSRIVKSNIEIFNYFKEYVSVYLIVEDPEIAKNVLDAYEHEGVVEQEFEIHRVGSTDYDLEPQNLIDNLASEVSLYEYYEIDVHGLKKTVYHYGVDYGETGEDEEEGAKRIILNTPFVWNTIERYNEIMADFEALHNAEGSEEDLKKNEKKRSERTSDDFLNVIKRGESKQVEFKPALVYNFKTKEGGIGVKYINAKAICGFLNSKGGLLFIGVKDDGTIQGLEESDYSLSPKGKGGDAVLLELDDLLKRFFGPEINSFIEAKIQSIEGKDILIIEVFEKNKPVFLQNNINGTIINEFYIRMNASTRRITESKELVDYVFSKKWNE